MFADGLVALLNEGSLVITSSRCEIHPDVVKQARSYYLEWCQRKEEADSPEVVAMDDAHSSVYRDVIFQVLEDPKPYPQDNGCAPYKMMGYHKSRPFTTSVACLLEHMATLKFSFQKKIKWKSHVRDIIRSLVKDGELALLDADTLAPVPVETLGAHSDKKCLISLPNNDLVLHRMEADKKIIEELTDLYISHLPGKVVGVEGKMYDSIRAGKVRSIEQIYPASMRDRSIPLFYYIPNISATHKGFTQFLRSKEKVILDPINSMVHRADFECSQGSDSSCSSESSYALSASAKPTSVENFRSNPGSSIVLSSPSFPASINDLKWKEALQRALEIRNSLQTSVDLGQSSAPIASGLTLSKALNAIPAPVKVPTTARPLVRPLNQTLSNTPHRLPSQSSKPNPLPLKKPLVVDLTVEENTIGPQGGSRHNNPSV